MSAEEPLIIIVSNNESFQKEASLKFQNENHSFEIQNLSVQEAFTQAKSIQPLGLIIDLDHPDEQDESVILSVRKLTEYFPNTKVVCTGSSLSVPFILKLIRVGANDFLKYPFDPDEVKLLARQITTAKPQARQPVKERRGKIITVFSPKGGTGVTLFTVNLAASLSRRKSDQVTIVDLMPQCGDTATYMNLEPKYTIRDLMDQYAQIDLSLLEGMLLRHESNVKVLAAPQRGADALTNESVQNVVSMLLVLRENNEFTIVDGGHIDNPILSAVLEHSDQVILMGTLDVPSLRGLMISFNQLLKLRLESEKIKVIINRYNAKSQLNAAEFENKTKQHVACYLPNNYPLCIEAVNTGRLLRDIKSKDELVKRIEHFAAVLRIEASSPEDEPKIAQTNETSDAWTLKGFLRCL